MVAAYAPLPSPASASEREAPPHGLPGHDALAAITATQGVDVATTVLLRALREQPANRAFIDAVERHQRVETSLPGAELLIVPALFWEQHPELGADGAVALHAARSLGLSAERLSTASRGGVVENAERLAAELRRRGRPTWLLSISKGAAEVRVCLEQLFSPAERQLVAGWINFGGLPRGSHLVDRLLRSPVARARIRVGALGLGLAYAAVDELRTDHPHFACSTDAWLHGLKVVNVIGLPTSDQVGSRLKRRHRRLSPLGPNDGMVRCLDALVQPGVTLPVEGADHFFTGVDTAALLPPLLAAALTSTTWVEAAPPIGPAAKPPEPPHVT